MMTLIGLNVAMFKVLLRCILTMNYELSTMNFPEHIGILRYFLQVFYQILPN